MTVDLDELVLPEVWIPGVTLGVVVAFVIRPVLVGLCLVPVRLHRREKAFICSPASRARCRSCSPATCSRRTSRRAPAGDHIEAVGTVVKAGRTVAVMRILQ